MIPLLHTIELERRIRYAWDYRKTVMGEDISCCRIIFGEADEFPGLTIDRFNDILVAQVLSLGIEKRKDIIFNLVYKILKEDYLDWLVDSTKKLDIINAELKRIEYMK